MSDDSLTARLSKAEAALHKILTTGGVARIREGEKWIEYYPANVALLRAYIAELRGGRVSQIVFSSSKGL